MKKRKHPPTKRETHSGLLIPSGSVLLNCACSDHIEGAYRLGKLVNIIGDSSSGKTLLALTGMAECTHLDAFSNFRLIYDDAENALEFDMEEVFGPHAATLIETSTVSDTIQDFKRNVITAIAKGQPFIYILDSFDALESEEQLKRSAKALKSGKDEDGTYGLEKPKMASQMLREITGALTAVQSTLIIISQTRMNIGFGAQFNPKIRSGGVALKFYATHEIWLTHLQKIKVPELKQQIGVETRINVTKNKLTGKRRMVEVPIFDGYGIDDIGSQIDFLVDTGYWKKTKHTIEARGLNIKGTRDKLINLIEGRSLETRLKGATQKAWLQMEKALKPDRKPRFPR